MLAQTRMRPLSSKNEKDEQHEREMKMNEEAWENARKSGF